MAILFEVEIRFFAAALFESEASATAGEASSEVENTSSSASKVRIDMIDPFPESHENAGLRPTCSRKG
ncbi:MAG: hypothetical protein CMJ95_13435 [Planctomycetes bacterium]|nr:hypothetical protein [Planctomycetota bacterium]